MDNSISPNNFPDRSGCSQYLTAKDIDEISIHMW